MADTQKSDRSSLSLHAGPNAFVQSLEGTSRLQLHYTEEEAHRSIRAYVTTLLGSPRCRMDVQVAGGEGMLLRYVTSHVTKMHDASTSEGLYSSDKKWIPSCQLVPLNCVTTGTRNGLPAAWMNKMTKQFRPPYPGQEAGNAVY